MNKVIIQSVSLTAEDSDGEQESIVLRKRPETNLRNIRVIKTKAGVQEEVAYSDLDRQSQKEVITDLLVKSAVHYALKKQEVRVCYVYRDV